MERLLLTTGGTGGHIFPALAVAEALRRENPQARVLFVGSDYGPEARLAAAAGLEFAGLPVRGLVGRGLRAVGAAARMGWASSVKGFSSMPVTATCSAAAAFVSTAYRAAGHTSMPTSPIRSAAYSSSSAFQDSR